MLNEDNLASELPRILIVDDSRMVRASLRKHLTGHYDLVEEADGEAAWTRLQQDASIRLMISDVSMPKLDGHGLLQRIRACDLPALRSLPIIIISGDEDDAAKQHAADLGANDFITKSTDQVELLARIKGNLSRIEAEKQLRTAQQTIEFAATTDPVTGLFTQNYVIRQGQKFMAYARRHDEPVAVLAIGLDRFDELTQRYPDVVCNKILQMFGKMLSAKLRGEDVVARCEDQYFAIALPNTSLNQAIIAAERVCQATAGAKITYRGDVIKLSCSIGLACSSQAVEHDFEGLLALASARLGMAQDQGGNWIEGQAIPENMPAPTASAVLEDSSMDVLDMPAQYNVEQALELIRDGRHTEVQVVLPALMKELLPLLELGSAYFQLDWSMDSLREQLGEV